MPAQLRKRSGFRLVSKNIVSFEEVQSRYVIRCFSHKQSVSFYRKENSSIASRQRRQQNKLTATMGKTKQTKQTTTERENVLGTLKASMKAEFEKKHDEDKIVKRQDDFTERAHNGEGE